MSLVGWLLLKPKPARWEPVSLLSVLVLHLCRFAVWWIFFCVVNWESTDLVSAGEQGSSCSALRFEYGKGRDVDCVALLRRTVAPC